MLIVYGPCPSPSPPSLSLNANWNLLVPPSTIVYVGSFLSDGRDDPDIDFSLPCRPVSISFLSPAEKLTWLSFGGALPVP